MGRRIVREVLKLHPPLPASDTSRYFERVLEVLAASACEDRTSFRLVAVSEARFGAVSIPGGTIVVGRELLTALEDEAMLAFVLAREMAHQASGRTHRRYLSRRESRSGRSDRLNTDRRATYGDLPDKNRSYLDHRLEGAS